MFYLNWDLHLCVAFLLVYGLSVLTSGLIHIFQLSAVMLDNIDAHSLNGAFCVKGCILLPSISLVLKSSVQSGLWPIKVSQVEGVFTLECLCADGLEYVLEVHT